MIFNIQRFSTHDGAGIRTIIFYKGCPLRCEWCCNPESQSFEPDILFDGRKCKSFDDCLATGISDLRPPRFSKPWRSQNLSPLSNIEIFRNICPTRAIQVSGEEISPEELLIEIEKDLPFYKHSGGGVTLSGGEPLSQGNNLVEFLAALKNKNLNVAIETSLHVDWSLVKRCVGLVDTFLVDVKHTDAEKFNRYTCGDLNRVIGNLKKLAGLKQNVIARIPVIPDFNHTLEEIKNIIDFIDSLHSIHEIHFLPYHSLGTEKYTMLGMEYVFGKKKPVEETDLNKYIDYARNKGFTVRTGG